jgi:hypothetical protein
MRKFLLLTTTTLVVCLASGFVSLQSQQKEEPYWKLEVPTPVEDGVLTDRQKEHSKFYKAWGKPRKIRDAVIKDGGFESFRIVCGAFLDLPDLITELSEKADAVVIVSFVSKSSQITSDGTDIFTDYDLRTEQILKDASPVAIKPDGTITVTRPGGKVLLFGRIASVGDSAYESLMPGRRYLLFLSYIPATGAYRAVDHASSFDITEVRVRTLSSAAFRPYATDLGDFIASVKLAIANSQQKGRTK